LARAKQSWNWPYPSAHAIELPMKTPASLSAPFAASWRTSLSSRTQAPTFAVGFIIASLALVLGATTARADTPRLINLSARGPVGTGSGILVGGFAIGQGTPETLLIRAVGPALTTFGFRFVLLAPVLSLFDSSGKMIQTNQGWSTGTATAAIMSSAGAFALPSGSADSALVVTLPAGVYTAQVSGAGATTGNVLLEIYEVGATSTTARLTNLSVRGEVQTVTNNVIPTGTETSTDNILLGFVLGGGTGNRSILVRVAGPSLTQFGLQGVLADPYVNLVDSTNAPLASNGNWGTPVGNGASAATISAAFASAGAFPFATGSLDSALIASVPPGAADTAVVTPDTTSTNNLALIELYDITPN
jgi:hypothetical protein